MTDRERTLAMIALCAAHQDVSPPFMDLGALGTAPAPDLPYARGEYSAPTDRGVEGAQQL